jgi:arginine exporter protein ArgO
MSRRITGVLFLAISALLYSARFITAAIFGSSLANWSSDLFNAMLQYVGKGLVTWSVVALVAGILYLVWAEFEAWRSGGQSDVNSQATNLKFNIEEVNYVIHPESD